MKNRIVVSAILAGLFMFSLIGCKKEEPISETPAVDEVINEEDAAPEIIKEICSLCEVQKVCGEYTADGQIYVVCPDCYNEFASAFEDTADKHICSACETEQICGKYTVDGTNYYVCIGDFDEFAHGMGLY